MREDLRARSPLGSACIEPEHADADASSSASYALDPGRRK